MKKIFLIIAALTVACVSANAQNMLGRLADRAKNAAENAVGRKIENAVYNAVDKATSKKTPSQTESVTPARPEPVVSTQPVSPAQAAVKKAPVPVTDPIPGAVSFKYIYSNDSEGKYSVYSRADGQSRLDSFDEGEELNENDVLEKYSYHDVMLQPKRDETPVKYEDGRWTESYAAMQELSIMWLALISDRSEFYVRNDGFKESGTEVVCGKTCTKYTGTIKTMGGYDLFIMNGSSAEIYSWNGYTMKLVMGGKVVYEVVGYTELVPASAFTQTLDVNWL